MTDRRFDNRSQDTFKKDIKFGTAVENHLFKRWVDSCHQNGTILNDWSHNGVDNNGEFVETGKKTSGADFRVTMEYLGIDYDDVPMEFKWVPTRGKFTLKSGDVKAYIKEESNILFVYNNNWSYNLRKPKDSSGIDDHLERIDFAIKNRYIKWGVLTYKNLCRLRDDYADKVKPIPYMGNKPGFVLEYTDYAQYFVEEPFYV